MKRIISKKPNRFSAPASRRRTRDREALRDSEVRYRRLFEAAQDGILILDVATGCIVDVNPFLTRLLGRARSRLLGKKLWEIGLFQDVEKSRSAFRELQRNGYIRYEDLPLETRDGRYIDVEFVSNVYRAGGVRVIQCNIRDITDRKHAEVEKAILETVEEEQRRIGQDLHDGLCQQLTGIALLAKALAQKLSAVLPDESADASEISDLISRSIDQTRDLARGLSPVEIEADGLAPALQKLAFTIGRLYKISCEFAEDEISGPQTRYPPLTATHLYRITQEAVNNAVTHGKARRVVIALAVQKDRGTLSVSDDGVGYPAQANERPGLGLRSMRCRSRMIGARFHVSRGEGGGTLVTCSFPHQPKKVALV